MAETPADDQQRPDERPVRGESQSELRAWHRLAAVGFEFIVAVLMFGGIGYLIDKKTGTAPWLMVSGFGVGFVVGLYLLVRTANKSFHD